MTDRIEHRGPDKESFYLEDNIALGHRLLKTNNLSGEQPIFNEDKNIIAIECVPTVLVEACEKVKEEGITNIRFLEMRAEYLTLFIKEKSISEIYLNFSTPYPKNKHECHRLTYREFLDIYKKLLVDDGFIAQKTDSQLLFEYSLNRK